MMSKTISIWGSTDSGKTSFSIKLAKELSKKGNVVVVFLDKVAPPMSPFLFEVDEKGKSLGKLLASEMIEQDEILKHCVTNDKYKNLAFLGLNQGEHFKSYPSASNDKYNKLIIHLENLCDYVIFDLPSGFITSSFATMAMEMSDINLRMCGSNIKDISYFKSTIGFLSRNTKLSLDDDVLILSKVDENANIGILEGHYGKIDYYIPRVEEITVQLETGTLLTKDLVSKESKDYKKAVKKIICKIDGVEDFEVVEKRKKEAKEKDKLRELREFKENVSILFGKLKRGEKG